MSSTRVEFIMRRIAFLERQMSGSIWFNLRNEQEARPADITRQYMIRHDGRGWCGYVHRKHRDPIIGWSCPPTRLCGAFASVLAAIAFMEEPQNV